MKKRIIFALVLAAVLLIAFSEISEAARWRYHAWRQGHVTVWGTRNCRRVTIPLVYRRYMWRCQTIGGYLPWYSNDWLVRHEWGWPCYNVTWRKYVARPCPLSCWRKRWILGPLDEYFGDYVPYYYGVDEVTVPTIGDPNGHLTGNQELYIFVDLGEWLDAGQPYIPPPPETDPNDVYYDFSNGISPDLPGFTVMRVDPPGTPVEDLIVFNPDAPPESYPFEITRPDLLFNGRLYLEGEQIFDSEPYNGCILAGDNNLDGVVNLQDVARLADVYLEDVSMECQGLCVDADGDGYGLWASASCTYPEQDCDDADPTVYPGAPELCDGKDNDCDGLIPPEEMTDADMDGWVECSDCDDADPTVYPGAPEICDGKDNDCDGMLPPDEQDADADGVSICMGDCDDGDPTIYPGATELCDGKDNDCDGSVPPLELDSDGDGWRICEGDCDDGDPTKYPGAPELCDGEDNDCDGSIPPEELTDNDGDGWVTCLDCDDGDSTTYPGASEICDGKDNDCDGMLPPDELDIDGDGWSICMGDCQDFNPMVNPGMPEICDDGIDNDCDYLIDMDDDDCMCNYDGICDPWEDPFICDDCICNYDGICDPWEDPFICDDCICNYDGICDPWEDPITCMDCGPPPCWDCPTQCHGDADCSTVVDFTDMDIMYAAMYTCFGMPGYDPCADFNRDGCVDEFDEGILMMWLGQEPPPDCPPGPGPL